MLYPKFLVMKKGDFNGKVFFHLAAAENYAKFMSSKDLDVEYEVLPLGSSVYTVKTPTILTVEEFQELYSRKA